jgi:hypothetical protein
MASWPPQRLPSVATSPSWRLRRWHRGADFDPWQITLGSQAVVGRLLKDLDPSEYVIDNEIAVHKRAVAGLFVVFICVILTMYFSMPMVRRGQVRRVELAQTIDGHARFRRAIGSPVFVWHMLWLL